MDFFIAHNGLYFMIFTQYFRKSVHAIIGNSMILNLPCKMHILIKKKFSLIAFYLAQEEIDGDSTDFLNIFLLL